MTYVLGVDAGNTKTIALVARPDGTIVGVGRGGCGDIYSVFSDLPRTAQAAQAALAAVEATVLAALEAAGLAPGDLLTAAFSMAGADWPEDIAFLHGEMARRHFGQRQVVVNDALGALRAGSPDGHGVAVVCGTGTAIGARAPSGQVWHSSHWIESLGGIQLGRNALRAVYRAALQIDPPTALTGRVLALFGQQSTEALLHRLTARVGKVAVDAGPLACLLLDEAETGDPTAMRLVREHGQALGSYAVAAARRVGLVGTAFTLVLAGGVFKHPSRQLADTLVEQVRRTSPGVRPVMSRFEPAVGALLLALDEIGHPVDECMLARLVASLPPATFFAT